MLRPEGGLWDSCRWAFSLPPPRSPPGAGPGRGAPATLPLGASAAWVGQAAHACASPPHPPSAGFCSRGRPRLPGAAELARRGPRNPEGSHSPPLSCASFRRRPSPGNHPSSPCGSEVVAWETGAGRRLPRRVVLRLQPLAAFDVSEVEPCVCSECNEEEFQVYVQKHPWHTGLRALLCRLFPRYGNYCGPNFSSGRDCGSSVWDMQPVDCLDYCCYKHDMGYDSLDQYELLLADLKFLNCLQIILKDEETEIGLGARAYANFCVLGLQTVLIPYRKYFLESSRREYLQSKKNVKGSTQPFEPAISNAKKEIAE